jgi:hypothetical protein
MVNNISLPGTSVLNSTIADPPAGTNVVCTLFWFTIVPPSPYTLSKISPITWKEETRFGPPFPINNLIVSPTFAGSALSPVREPTAPLNTT